jgi:hypothetical protein
MRLAKPHRRQSVHSVASAVTVLAAVDSVLHNAVPKHLLQKPPISGGFFF